MVTRPPSVLRLVFQCNPSLQHAQHKQEAPRDACESVISTNTKAEKLSDMFILVCLYSVVTRPYIVWKASLTLAAQGSGLVKVRFLTQNVQLYKLQDHSRSFPDFFLCNNLLRARVWTFAFFSCPVSFVSFSHLGQSFRFLSRCLHSRHPQRQTQTCPMTRWSPISREYTLQC